MKRHGLRLFSALAMFAVIAYTAASCGSTLKTSSGKVDASKAAEKEAKQMKKDGYDVPPGSPPLEFVLQKSWNKYYETTEEGQQKFLSADGSAIGGNQTAAEQQAIEMARVQLAGNIGSKVASLVSSNVANTELSDQEAETITEFVQSSKNIIAQRLGYTDPAFKVFRRLKNGNVEVKVRLFYDTEQSLKIARQLVKEELKDKVKTNEEDLRKLMGM